jgi:hypothetical protein
MTTINNNNNNETNNLTYSKFSKNVTGLYLKSIKEIIDQTINSDESVKYEAQLKLENS